MPENRYSQRIPGRTWELLKPIILRLYLLENKPLTASGGVKDIMHTEHGFLATKAQYETRLKRWGFYKYAVARDRRTQIPVFNNQRVEAPVTERHTREPENDSPTETYSCSQNITIRTSSPHCSALQPSPLSPISPRTSSLALAEGQHNNSPFSMGSANLQSPISRHEVELPIPQHHTWTSNATIGAEDPFGSALHRCVNVDTSPAVFRGLDDLELPGNPGILACSSYAMYADDFIKQNESGRSNLDSFLDGFPPLEIAFSSGFSVPDFATSILPIISHMFPRAVSSAQMIILGNSTVFGSALRNTVHPGTLQLVRQQSIDHQIVYMIFHRLINDGDAVRVLNEPKTELDQFFKAGITYCFSLGKRVLSSIINSTPSPYDLALIQNIFRAALVMGNGPVLNDVLEMNRASLANRSLLLGYSKCYPLEYTGLKGHMQTTQVLLNHGADPNRQTDCTGFLQRILGTPLEKRTSKVRVQILQLLVDHGLEPDPLSSVRRMGHCSRDELLVLATHCFNKSFETFFQHYGLPILLLQPAWDDSFSKTLEAILNQASLESNGRRDLWNSVLSESLSAAVLRSHASAVNILLAMGATPDTHCLISAAQSNDVQILKDFLNRGLDPNITALKTMVKTGAWNRDISCTALSESIVNRSRGAFQVLQAQGFISALAHQPAGFVSAFVAACQVGDSALIEQLLSMPNFPRRQARLGKAITAAMEESQYHIIERLLSGGIKPTLLSLELAVRKKQLTTVILLARCMDIPGILEANYCQYERYNVDQIPTPYENGILWEALRWGDQTAIEHVLKIGHPIHVCNSFRGSNLEDWHLLPEVQTPNPFASWSHTPLGVAILKRNPTAVKTLMAYGEQAVLFNARCTSYQSRSFVKTASTSSEWILTPLAAAAVVNDLALIREVLRIGADPFDNSALFICAALDSDEGVVALLLSAFKTRYPDGMQYFGSDALYQTMRRGNSQLLKLLAKATDITGPVEEGGSEPPSYDIVFTSPLGEAIRLYSEGGGAGGVLDHLLPLVKDLNAVVHRTRKHGNMTSLLYAISLKSLEAVRKLHQAGADTLLPAEWQIPRTPLQAAAQAGSKDIVEYLLLQGVGPNEPPAARAGATALQLAAITGNVGIATILLDMGADVNAPPALCDGRTAFEGATEHGRLEMMIFLVQRGADLVSHNGQQYQRAVDFAEDNTQHAAKSLADELYGKALANQGTSFIDMSGDAWAGTGMDSLGHVLP